MKRIPLLVALFALVLPGFALHSTFAGPQDDATYVSPAKKIFIVSAPSGAGKTTLIEMLMKQHPDQIGLSISTTTRNPRPGEINGTHYHFVTRDQFQEQIKEGNFLECDELFGNWYGTSRKPIENFLAEGKSVLLTVSFEKIQEIQKAFPGQSTTVFISPGSLKVLEERLRHRGTESEESLQERLKGAEEDMKHIQEYDHVILNDQLEVAFEEFRKLILNYEN